MKLTETITPDECPYRYRKKGTSAHVIASFIENKYPVASSANLHLDRGVLYSYGRHWPLARWLRRIDTETGRFMLIRSDKGSATRATKHRALLINAASRMIGGSCTWFVPFVMADEAKIHEINYHWKVAQSEEKAEASLRGPKDLRQGKAWQAVDSLMVAFHYANCMGLTGKPDGETPHGILADWLEENMPELVHLRRCAHALCPITGVPLDEP